MPRPREPRRAARRAGRRGSARGPSSASRPSVGEGVGGQADRQLAVDDAARRSRRAPCAARPAPRPRRTGPCWRRPRRPACRAAGSSASGRESQSSAFLSWPGIEWLYSGVAKRTASASRIAGVQRRAGSRARLAAVVVGVVGRHRLQALPQLELHPGRQQARRRPEELRVVGVPAQAARDSQDLHYALDQLEVDVQLDVVGQREAALGQRVVPADAEVRAVDARPRA